MNFRCALALKDSSSSSASQLAKGIHNPRLIFCYIDIVSQNLVSLNPPPDPRDMHCIGFIASLADVHGIMEYADVVSKLLKLGDFSGYVRDVFN